MIFEVTYGIWIDPLEVVSVQPVESKSKNERDSVLIHFRSCPPVSISVKEGETAVMNSAFYGFMIRDETKRQLEVNMQMPPTEPVEPVEPAEPAEDTPVLHGFAPSPSTTEDLTAGDIEIPF